MVVNIRLAEPPDVSELLVLVQELAQHHGDEATLNTEVLHRDLFGPRQWVVALVATSGEDLIGYAILCPLVQLQYGARGMDMHHLYVKSEWRGHGVGRMLTQACLEEAVRQNCSYMAVGTHPNNLTAQQFYGAMGFELSRGAGPRFRMNILIVERLTALHLR
jgi:GNAT superfamily N-acetyltransferase